MKRRLHKRPPRVQARNRRHARASYERVLARRVALKTHLGGRCAEPGCSRLDLEFDHAPGTRTWKARALSHRQRMDAYERDASAGVLTLRCRSHNAVRRLFDDLDRLRLTAVDREYLARLASTSLERTTIECLTRAARRC